MDPLSGLLRKKFLSRGFLLHETCIGQSLSAIQSHEPTHTPKRSGQSVKSGKLRSDFQYPGKFPIALETPDFQED
jgi:hypothetical protein